MVVTKKVTSDAHAVELVAHTRVFEELRAGQHQYKIIMAAHILSGSSPTGATSKQEAPDGRATDAAKEGARDADGDSALGKH